MGCFYLPGSISLNKYYHRRPLRFCSNTAVTRYLLLQSCCCSMLQRRCHFFSLYIAVGIPWPAPMVPTIHNIRHCKERTFLFSVAPFVKLECNLSPFRFMTLFLGHIILFVQNDKDYNLQWSTDEARTLFWQNHVPLFTWQESKKKCLDKTGESYNLLQHWRQMSIMRPWFSYSLGVSAFLVLSIKTQAI